MTDIPAVLRMRHRRRQRQNRNPSQRIGLIVSALFGLALAIAAITTSLLYSSLTQDLPSTSFLPQLLDPPNGLFSQPTRLYDRTGGHLLLTLQNPAITERRFISVDESFFSNEAHEASWNNSLEILAYATLAASDPNFWTHSGYSLQGLLSNESPTLAQRLVSDHLLWNEPSGLRRSLRERLLAGQITRQYGRQKILTWFLNYAAYGRQTYGIDSAAHVYFGKSVNDLNFLECAILAGVAEAPGLNPLDAPDMARKAGLEVLRKMLAQGRATPEQVATAIGTTLQLSPPVKSPENPAQSFTSLVLQQLYLRIDRSRLERGGFRIRTSLNNDLQQQALCSTKTQLMRVKNVVGEIGLSEDETCEAARLLPTLPAGDSIQTERLETNLVIMDPNSGEILALASLAIHPDASDKASESPGFLYTPLLEHPAGTTLSPFVFLTAFTRGYTPATLVWDILDRQLDTAGQNFDGRFHGPVRSRIALVNDYLTPAMQILSQIGNENVIQTLQRMGIHSETVENEQQTTTNWFDQTNLTLLDLAQAYSIIANQGNQTGWNPAISDKNNQTHSLYPVTVLRVEDYSGNLVADQDGANGSIQTLPIISPQLAYLMTHILSDEPARWPSMGHPNPLEIGRPASAKFGRTALGTDLWTIGYTPQFLVGIWMGNPDIVPPGGLSPKIITGLWHGVMQFLNQNMPPAGWTMPPGVSQVEVCDPSGMLPTENCPNIVMEIFPTGSEPTQSDTLYQSLQVNRETGRLATIFTPPEFIVERVYLMAPPEASAWAGESGLEIPPDTYDVIVAASPQSQDAHITTPSMFAYVNGQVSIHGTATGAGFQSYRVQVGKGLNPKEWQVIGEESSISVEEGKLQTWNTEDLSGLFVVQLVVIRQDQKVESDTIQVTVDNTLPEVSITYPSQGQQINQSQKKEITIQARASDDLGLKSLDFYVDGKLIYSATQSPYAYPWQTISGNHTLRVEATDLAGNKNEATVTLTVNP